MKPKFKKRVRGTPRQIGKPFPILPKKKLPEKISLRLGGKLNKRHFELVASFINENAPITEENEPEVKKVRTSWSRIYRHNVLGDNKKPTDEDYRIIDNFIDIQIPEYMSSDVGIRSVRRAWGKILLASPKSGGKIIPKPKVWTSEYGWLTKEEYDKTDRAARERQERQKLKERLAMRLESKKFTKPGVFELGGEIFILKPNRSKTGFYTLKLVERTAKRVTENGKHVPFDFEYAPDAIYKLTESDRMSLGRAKHFLIRYGKCIACGRKLKVAKSVEQGMGPVCIKYFR